MGLLFNSLDEIRDKVSERFDDTNNYLVAIKHDNFKKSSLKFLLSSVFYVFDSNRNFIIYFSPKGIYEKEMSNSIKGEFVLIPWNEISGFKIDKKSNKAILKFKHLGKEIGYEIDFDGKIMADNRNNLNLLEDKDFNRI